MSEVDDIKRAIRFPVVEAETFNRVYDSAVEYALSRMKRPVFDETDSEVNDYPKSFTRPVNALLVIVLVIAFLISAGKQALAAYLIMHPVAEALGGLLGEVWIAISVVGSIVLSEAGVLLFLIVAIPLSRGNKVVRRILYVYAALCVVLAALGNVVITSQHQFDSWLVNLYLWFFTGLIPLLVVGVGIVYERQFMARIYNYVTAKKRYREAVTAYETAVNDPESSADFKHRFVSGLLQEMRLASPRWVGSLLKADPRSKNWLLAQEFRAHKSLSTIDLYATDPLLQSVTDETKNVSTLQNPSPVMSQIKLIQEPVLVNGSDMPTKRDENSLQAVTSQLQKALNLIASNPDHYLNTSYSNLKEETGISTATWSRAINQYKKEKGIQ